ncbi:MAG: glycosyltransferase [bacterium]|nr:glycosyltransferase [bacterium]
MGIKESKGEIIFFTDDDCIVPPDWMATLLDGYKRHTEVVGVGGWHIPPDGELEKSATSRYTHYESFYHDRFNQSLIFYEVLTNNPVMFFGTFAYNTANICYKKEILRKVGGFKEDFYWPGSEDNDLAFRVAQAGYCLLYLPFNVIHSKAMNLLEFMKLHFRRGANGYFLRTMHVDILKKQNPGFIKDYGSIKYFIHHLNGPEKFLAFLEWLSLNAGIMYMKNKLTERDKPVLSKPEEKISND